MADLRELYQELILDHNRHPRNQHNMSDATSQAEGYNPVCGDKLVVYLKVDSGVVKAVSFEGCGCAISQASASLMTDAIQDKTIEEVHALFSRFQTMVTSDQGDELPVSLDKLSVFAGVRIFPARVKCATLAWHTLEAALKQDATTVTTE